MLHLASRRYCVRTARDNDVGIQFTSRLSDENIFGSGSCRTDNPANLRQAGSAKDLFVGRVADDGQIAKGDGIQQCDLHHD